jgi:HEAT repeat protein
VRIDSIQNPAETAPSYLGTRRVKERYNRPAWCGKEPAVLWWTLRQAKSDDPETCKKAARALGASSDPRALEALTALLDASRADVRRAAVQALASPAQPAVPSLVRALLDSDGTVRTEAFKALEATGSSWRTSEATVAAAPRLLGAKEPPLRLAAVVAVARRAEAAVPLLVPLLRDDDKGVREAVLAELDRMGPAWRRSEAARTVVSQLVEMLCGRGSNDTKTAAAVMLGAIGDGAATDALVRALRGNRHLAAPAARALGRIGDARALPALIEAMRTTSDAQREAARAALDAIDPHWRSSAAAREALAALQATLCEGDSLMRRTAAAVLQVIGWQPPDDDLRLNAALATGDPTYVRPLGPGVVARLVPLLGDPYQGTDAAALDLLYAAAPAWTAEVHAPAAVPALCALLQPDRPVAVRQRAARALGEIGTPDAVRALVGVVAASRNAADAMTDAVSHALARAGAVAVEPLLDAAAGPLAAKVGAILSTMDPSVTTSALVVALESPHPTTRRAAATALDANGWQPASDAERLAYLVAHERWSQLAALGCLAVPPLAKRIALANDADACAAIAVLTAVGTADAARVMAGALDEPRRAVRAAAAAGLERLKWTPPNPDAAAAYSAARRDWSALGRLGAAAVGRLAAALRDVDEPEGEHAATALAQIGSTEAFETLKGAVRDRDLIWSRRNAAANALDTMGRAFDGATALAYEILRDNWDAVVRCGPAAIDEIVGWGLGDGAVAALARIGDPRAIDPILRHYMPRQEVNRVAPHLRALLPGSRLTAEMLSLAGEFLAPEGAERVARQLCRIDSDVATNLLHLVLETRDYEFKEYDHKCEMEWTRTVSYEAARQVAREELSRRGNPPYQPEAYLAAPGPDA